MTTINKLTVLAAFIICALIADKSPAKENPQIEANVVGESSLVDLKYELCGSCHEDFENSVCDFSGDICTELLAPLDLNYTYLGCLKDRSGAQLAEPTIEDIAKLADYLFRGGIELTCDDIDFLSASQILDGVNIVTLTEVISGLFERTEATTTEN